MPIPTRMFYISKDYVKLTVRAVTSVSIRPPVAFTVLSRSPGACFFSLSFAEAAVKARGARGGQRPSGAVCLMSRKGGWRMTKGSGNSVRPSVNWTG